MDSVQVHQRTRTFVFLTERGPINSLVRQRVKFAGPPNLVEAAIPPILSVDLDVCSPQTGLVPGLLKLFDDGFAWIIEYSGLAVYPDFTTILTR
jgi:hypothetical protein